MSNIAKPLYNLLGNNVKFDCNEKCQSSFNESKDMWSKNLELNISDMKKSFGLETDASNIGLGAVLEQNMKHIAYISRTLSKAESYYSITEKETLAAIWGMEKFRFFIQGKKSLLITDDKALEEIKRKRDFGSPRIHRWFERLERFQYDVNF